MCALISGPREFQIRRDASYKYRQAAQGGQSGLYQQQDRAANLLRILRPQRIPSFQSSAAMRGHFSIEWMAQSSHPAGPETISGPATCGTHSESLPGFYCRHKPEHMPEQEENRSLNVFNQHQISNQGKCRESVCNPL